jgi:hypothetical protein
MRVQVQWKLQCVPLLLDPTSGELLREYLQRTEAEAGVDIY